MAFILDILLGEPDIFTHPVVYMGRLIKYIDDSLHKNGDYSNEKRERIKGMLLTLSVVAISVIIPAIMVLILGRISNTVRIVFECYFSYRLLATKSLYTESMKVYTALKNNGLEAGKDAVSMIVGRDTGSLNEEGVVKACVETIAENTSDGIIAPMIYIALFGVLGGFLYKAVNTLDSMVGYKNDKYIFFGRFSALTDDLFNYIPARIAGFIMALSCCLTGANSLNAVRIYFRDRRNHASPNSAHCEAAMAGALSVELAGDAWYFGKLHKKKTIGDSIRNIELEDIRRADRIMLVTSVTVLLLIVLILGLIIACAK